jgi:hypothetical protein
MLPEVHQKPHFLGLRSLFTIEKYQLPVILKAIPRNEKFIIYGHLRKLKLLPPHFGDS